jgi:hypothetical protein
MCTQSVDAGLGTPQGDGFVFPCADLQPNLFGKPSYDRPHMLKFLGSYHFPLGAFDLTAGFVGIATSKTTYSKSRTVSVLVPDSDTAIDLGTYFYENRGSDRVAGTVFQGDFSVEATYGAFRHTDLGIKFETFNLFNNEEKVGVDNTSWCNDTVDSTCATARANFGTATTRGSFVQPRTIRFTFLIRF